MRRDEVGCREGGGESQGFVRWEAPEVKVIIGGDGERTEKAAGLKGDEMSRCGGAEERSTRGMSGACQEGGGMLARGKASGWVNAKLRFVVQPLSGAHESLQ